MIFQIYWTNEFFLTLKQIDDFISTKQNIQQANVLYLHITQKENELAVAKITICNAAFATSNFHYQYCIIIATQDNNYAHFTNKSRDIYISDTSSQQYSEQDSEQYSEQEYPEEQLSHDKQEADKRQIIFRGALYRCPTTCDKYTITMEFISRPPNITQQIQELTKQLKQTPHYNELFQKYNKDQTSAVLSTRNLLFYCNCSTGMVNITHINKGKRIVVLERFLDNKMKFKYVNEPISEMEITVKANWIFEYNETIEIFEWLKNNGFLNEQNIQNSQYIFKSFAYQDALQSWQKINIHPLSKHYSIISNKLFLRAIEYSGTTTTFDNYVVYHNNIEEELIHQLFITNPHFNTSQSQYIWQHLLRNKLPSQAIINILTILQQSPISEVTTSKIEQLIQWQKSQMIFSTQSQQQLLNETINNFDNYIKSHLEPTTPKSDLLSIQFPIFYFQPQLLLRLQYKQKIMETTTIVIKNPYYNQPISTLDTIYNIFNYKFMNNYRQNKKTYNITPDNEEHIPSWCAYTLYVIQQEIMIYNMIYQCRQNHISSNTFEEQQWSFVRYAVCLPDIRSTTHFFQTKNGAEAITHATLRAISTMQASMRAIEIEMTGTISDMLYIQLDDCVCIKNNHLKIPIFGKIIQKDMYISHDKRYVSITLACDINQMFNIHLLNSANMIFDIEQYTQKTTNMHIVTDDHNDNINFDNITISAAFTEQSRNDSAKQTKNNFIPYTTDKIFSHIDINDNFPQQQLVIDNALQMFCDIANTQHNIYFPHEMIISNLSNASRLDNITSYDRAILQYELKKMIDNDKISTKAFLQQTISALKTTLQQWQLQLNLALTTINISKLISREYNYNANIDQ